MNHIYTQLHKDVVMMYLCVCVSSRFGLKHWAVLFGSRKCAEMITEKERKIDIHPSSFSGSLVVDDPFEP